MEEDRSTVNAVQPTGKRVGRAPEAANAVAMRDAAEPTLPISDGAIGKVVRRGNRKTKGDGISGRWLDLSICPICRTSGPDVHLFLFAGSAVGEWWRMRSTCRSW